MEKIRGILLNLDEIFPPFETSEMMVGKRQLIWDRLDYNVCFAWEFYEANARILCQLS